MDKDLAARRPEAADRWAQDQVAKKLMDEPKPMVEPQMDEDGIIRSPSRRAFLGLANEIKDAAARDAERRDKLGKELWSR